MRYNIKATNVQLTEELKYYVDKKVSMLKKYSGKIKLGCLDLEVRKITSHHNKGEIYSAEINLEVPGRLLRVAKTAKDLFKAIDKAKDHMSLIIKKYKDKAIDRKRQAE